jgi:hypothetical protein
MTNPYLETARRRKADAIVAYLWEMMEPADRVDADTLEALREGPQDARDLIAHWAGQNPPSEETWALVVRGVAQLMSAARWGTASEA